MRVTKVAEGSFKQGSQRLGRNGLLAMAALLAAAGPARAAATITYPTQGQRVKLDKRVSFTFRWKLAGGDSGPSVYVGDTPTYNPDTLDPFSPVCGVDGGQFDVSSTATSCRGPADGLPVPPGTHYALVTTTNASDTTQRFVSPVVRFVVPYKLGFGCSPLQPGCSDLAVESLYLPFGDSEYGRAYSRFVVNGWFNGPRVTFRFTIKRGRKVLKRLHQARSPDGYYSVNSGFKLYRLRGVAPGTRLTCVIEMSGDGVTTSRAVQIRSGAGSKVGAKLGFA
jgi:hypothetical protein